MKTGLTTRSTSLPKARAGANCCARSASISNCCCCAAIRPARRRRHRRSPARRRRRSTMWPACAKEKAAFAWNLVLQPPPAAASRAGGRHHRHHRRRHPRQAGRPRRSGRHARAPVGPHAPGADLDRRALHELSPSRSRRCRKCALACSRRPRSRAYCATPEPYDKAGGYGIQGLAALFVEHIEGSHSGIMGLPLYETAQLLRKAGLPLCPDRLPPRLCPVSVS